MDFFLLPRRPGRGAAEDSPSRFGRLHVAYDPAALDDDEFRSAPTKVYRDTTRTILSENCSPDLPFRYSLNPYRGYEHGCVSLSRPCLQGAGPAALHARRSAQQWLLREPNAQRGTLGIRAIRRVPVSVEGVDRRAAPLSPLTTSA